ncbi:hypothetical protein [Actinokineospora iranica]|uniref:Uncharacterized protein n=1 Tax=Actinokineospora iranica TaxID=1271860 RepID=A0A1G6YYS5_9PSEU|nr:hypothetical protein [Actinokineospora iranica]SDD94795.1 hypothetical protein SAMN05216174_12414 [Actinokineospora iranica]
MSALVLIPSHVVVPVGGGLSVRTIRVVVTINDVAYQVDRPLLMVGRNVALSPDVSVQGAVVGFHMDRWCVIAFGDTAGAGVQLPRYLGDQVVAARMARDFEGDPRIGWDSPEVEIEAWCVRWIETHRGGEVTAP